MKKATLIAIAVSLSAQGVVFAQNRELLFGPSENAAATKKQPPKQKTARQKVAKQSQPAKVVPKSNPAPSVAKVPTLPEVKSATVAPEPKVSAKPAIAAAAVAVAAPVAAAAAKKEEKTPEVAKSIPIEMPAATAKAEEKNSKPAESKPIEPAAKMVINTSGNDPFSESRKLASVLKESVTVGFFPSVTGNQDSYSFLKNFLPLANYLSEKTGVLFVLSEERNIPVFRKNILENKYPVIFVNAIVVGDAIKSGYVPVAMGKEDLGVSFVMRADAPYKSLDDLSGLQFSWSENAQITMLAKYELAKRNLVDKNKYSDVGTGGRTAALASLNSKLADIAVMRSTEGKQAVSQSSGSLKELNGSVVWPSSGAWIRKDLANTDFAKRMASALMDVSPNATGSAKFASESFQRGFGVKGEFRPITPGELDEKAKIVDVVTKGWPTFAFQGAINQKKRDANLALAPFHVNTKPALTDVYSKSFELKSRFPQSFNVGFFVTKGPNIDVYNFNTSFYPLADYISEETGNAVNLIPEHDPNQFINKISRNIYPAIIVGPSMSLAAISSGYLPVARGGDFVTPAFVVKSDSAIQGIKNLSGKRIATVRASDAETVGRWELLKNKVDTAQFEYLADAVRGTTVLDSGAVDALLVRPSEAQAILKASPQKYKVIYGKEEVPAVSAWVRHDIYDSELMGKFANALTNLSKSENPVRNNAFAAVVRGYGTSDPWQASGIEEHTSSVQMIEDLLKANQSSVNEAPALNYTNIDKIRALPISVPNPAAQKQALSKK